MRTLIVFHLGGFGGPSRSIAAPARRLAERGSVEVIVPEHGVVADAYAAVGAVTVARYSAVTYPRTPRQGLALARELRRDVRLFRRELRRRRPDLVVAITTVLPALLVAARLERVPVVVYAAEIYTQRWKSAALLRPAGGLLAGVTALLADGIVACSDAVARQFPTRFGTAPAVAYPPIDASYGSGDRARGRERYGLGPDDFCVAVVGSISRGRGQDVAIGALGRVRARLPSARLLIVGAPHPRAVDLEFAEQLRALAHESGVEDAVTFAAPTEAVADVYAAADVIVNPARFAEPFGRVAPEALVAGRPVVASRVGAIPEVLRDGVDGLLVTPEDVDELADAIVRVAEDQAAAEVRAVAGRRRVLERFGQEQAIAAWTRVVEVAVPALR